MSVIVPPQCCNSAPCNRNRRVSLVLGNLAQHPTKREARACIGHPLGSIRFGKYAERCWRILDSLDRKNGQVRTQIVAGVGGHERGWKSLLFLRTQTA